MFLWLTDLLKFNILDLNGSFISDRYIDENNTSIIMDDCCFFFHFDKQKAIDVLVSEDFKENQINTRIMLLIRKILHDVLFEKYVSYVLDAVVSIPKPTDEIYILFNLKYMHIIGFAVKRDNKFHIERYMIDDELLEMQFGKYRNTDKHIKICNQFKQDIIGYIPKYIRTYFDVTQMKLSGAELISESFTDNCYIQIWRYDGKDNTIIYENVLQLIKS